jgi:phospholipid/cholesterol/gamma-HCH transport system substrate-binding protein
MSGPSRLRMPGGRLTAVLAGVLVLAVVVVGAVVALSGGTPSKHLTAYFPRTIGLYKGNDVRILGIKVGTVDSLTPDGSQVKVTMSYSGRQRVPAGAVAELVEPSIVSDRYVELTPAYTTGAELANNAVLSEAHTQTPLELDNIFANINSLDKALGPHGANAKGALSRLVNVSAKNLAGNGTRINGAIKEFAAAISTLSGSRGNLYATVAALSKFTTMLAHHDGGVRALNSNLATVGTQLAGERQDLGAALASLSQALSAVNGFVAANRSSLTGDIHGLASVTNVLTKEKEAITELTDQAPLALSDLALSFDPKAATLDTKADLSTSGTTSGNAGALCQLLGSLGLTSVLGAPAGCTSATKTISLVNVPHATSLSQLLQVTK